VNETSDTTFGVFVGVYDGEPYLDSVLEQLRSQTDQNFKIVLLDNASSDNSWDLVQRWQEIFGSRIILARNDNNLGGGGSLYKALQSELVSTDWFTAFHQDDFYLPNHILELRKAISTCKEDEIAVFTSMGSIQNSGKTQASHPRISWLAEDNSIESAFLLNLRSHALPWPSTAFKTEEFKKCFRSWHNPAFVDTEVALLLCGHGRFKSILKETMRYRENPLSESHVVGKIESILSVSISLSRVFNSSEFKTILDGIDIKDRGNFYLEMISALEVRLGKSPLNTFLKILTTERCAQVWNFTDSTSVSVLATNYEAMGSKFTSNLLNSLVPGEREYEVADSTQELKGALEFLADQRATELLLTNMVVGSKNPNKIILGALPLRLRVIIFRFYVRARAIKQPDYIWNTRWR
jgi:glycosyltransferase involved in cell wall biosynthesis